MTQMTQAQIAVAVDPTRQAAYRRLALTILSLDVPSLTVKLQAAPATSRTQPVPRRVPQAA